MNGERWKTLPDTAAYTRRILAGESVEHFVEELSPTTRTGEIAAFAIRTREGLAASDLAPWAEPLREFHELGFLEHRGDRVVLTRRGKLMADAVAEAFV